MCANYTPDVRAQRTQCWNVLAPFLTEILAAFVVRSLAWLFPRKSNAPRRPISAQLSSNYFHQKQPAPPLPGKPTARVTHASIRPARCPGRPRRQIPHSLPSLSQRPAPYWQDRHSAGKRWRRRRESGEGGKFCVWMKVRCLPGMPPPYDRPGALIAQAGDRLKAEGADGRQMARIEQDRCP
jgi:hypothetical protein